MTTTSSAAPSRDDLIAALLHKPKYSGLYFLGVSEVPFPPQEAQPPAESNVIDFRAARARLTGKW